MAKKENRNKKPLNVNKGVDQPESFNRDAARKLVAARKKRMLVEELVRGILGGERTVLSRAITMVESTLARDQETAQQVIAGCLPKAGNSIRLGITGVPGVGKSTFIEAFGKMLTSKGHKVAVLAVDPSSQRSKGSILGDKTRMEELASDEMAFIRPSSTAGTLGGVARRTRESIILCEAAGFDVIIVETVGVGQSEVAVHGMVDFFLLLMLPGAGDELQGIKRGIMEMADGIVINKSDGSNKEKAALAKAELDNALHLFPPKEGGWVPPVNLCSSVYREGLKEVWDFISDFRDGMTNSGFFAAKRKEQAVRVLEETIDNELRSAFYNDPAIREKFEQMKRQILTDELSPYQAAGKIVGEFMRGLRSE